MTTAESAELDESLFSPGPARDDRFTAVDRWVDCANYPVGDPRRLIEFFHRQMNEEVDSLECSAVSLADYPDTDWELRLALARQCWDEARHAVMFRRIFEQRGGTVGTYPVLNFQYRIIANIGSLIGRLAVQNRSFEAGGLDAIAAGIDSAREEGDEEMALLFEAQAADEIVHVRFANEAINAATSSDPRAIMQIGVAMTNASKAFVQVMGDEATEGVQYPADVSGRLEAGFTDDEVELSSRLQE
jgi:uncharacterized ferritin-like protein (DUF455 family)